MVHQRESPRANCPRSRKDSASSPISATFPCTAGRARLNSGGSRSPTISTSSPRASTQLSHKPSFLSPASKSGNGQSSRSILGVGAKGSASSSSSTSRHCSPLRSPCSARAETLLPRIGARVAIASGAQGVVRFTGQTHFKPGLWVGVELDDALGKGDGSVQGHTYFHCAPLHSIFVMPSTLQILSDGCNESRDVSPSVRSRSPKHQTSSSQLRQIIKPNSYKSNEATTCSSQRQMRSVEEEVSTVSTAFQSDFPLRSSTSSTRHIDGISLADQSTELSPARLGDDDTEGISALHEMYGADWCNPTLYSSQKKKNGEHDRINKTPAKEVEISDITERLSFSGGQRKVAALSQERDAEGASLSDEHRLLYAAMDGLRIAAECAITRAETAEAKLATQTLLLATPNDAKNQPFDAQRFLAEEVKAVIAAEIKTAVKLAVDDATSELREVVAEARQLRDAVRPSAEMVRDFHAALTFTQGIPVESNKCDVQDQRLRDDRSELEGREALMTLAMKAIARQVLGPGSNDLHKTPSVSTDDAHSTATLASASRTQSVYSSVSCSRATSADNSPSRGGGSENVVEVDGSARLVPAHEDFLLGSPQVLKEAPLAMTPTASAELQEEAPTAPPSPCLATKSENAPQRSVSVPGLLENDLEPQESRRVRDVVSKFEKILPGRGQNQQDAPLAPWPFAPVPRCKGFAMAATPWSTSLSSGARRPARTASMSALH